MERSTIRAIEFLGLLTKNQKVHNFIIKGKVEISKLEVKSPISAEIVNCYFLDECDLRTDDLSNIHFTKCQFKHRLFISGHLYDHIAMSKCKFETYIALKKVICNKLFIEDCTIENDKITQLQEFRANVFNFKRNHCSADILIKPEALLSLTIEGNGNHYLITYSGQDIKEPLESLTLFTFSNYKCDYLFRSFQAKKFNVVGELKDSILNVNNCKLDQGILHGFINLGTLIINGVKNLSDDSVLIIKTSYLGKAQINNMDFSMFKQVVLESSNMLEILPVNIKWCTAKNVISKDLSSQKENFRQLKIVSIKNEDIESKLYFHKLEMHTLLKLNSSYKSQFNNKFILQTNFLSNDFGLNWIQALGWLISISAILFTLIKWILGYRHFDSAFILDDIGRFLIFINPIHQFDKIFDIDIYANSKGALLLDSISRIFGAYIIYQFISSFRKYSSK